MIAAALQLQLQEKYRRETWQTLLPQLLPGVELFAHAHDFPLTSEHERGIATTRRQFGAATLADGKRIAFYEIEVAPGIQLLSNRVGLRNLIARCIDEVSAHAVLAFFIQPGLNSYRLTYAAKESTLNVATLAVETRETATRRFTYILGPGESCRTAADRLAGLPTSAKLSDLTDAFSVEKLNKEFFADFCRSFDRVSKDIRQHHAKWSDADVEREAQTILDRLVFLYFVQRKGWLNRQRDYLFRHFREQHAGKAGQTYFQQFLRPLFVKLSTEGMQADIPGHDLPFLNGGLFNDEYGDDQSDDAARRRTEVRVGNDTLHFVFENLLERYNFTIHEDSPTNQEVAIDPEMLGKIFESLVLQIEQSDTGGKSLRHDTGSHYTPRPIVHYLCVAALAGWLENQPPFAGKANAHERIGKLLALDASEGLNDAERTTLNECLTPEEAATLLDTLATLRACDPSVGSGAFPMGLLRELLNLARLCETRARGRDPVDGDHTWLYEAKKRIIERVIYGVDLQERAIEICKLRLWLSLMVDNDLGVDPLKCDARSFRRALAGLEPLPNLDFKIRRADSLVDKIHGEPVELGKLARETGAALPLSRLTSAKRAFFNARTAAAKRKLRLDIYQAITELARLELTRARTDAAGMGLALDEESTRRVAELDHGLKEIAFLAAQVHDARRLRAASQDESLERIRARLDDPHRPTFVWQLDFAEVFHRFGVPASAGSAREKPCELGLSDTAPPKGGTPNGGFDLMLGNPPYVRIQVLNQSAPEAVAWFKGHYAAAARGSYDLYVVFVERGLRLLAPGGQLAYILPHKFFNAQYGGPLRELLAKGRHLRHVVHFGDQQIFPGATNYVCLLFLAQSGVDACRWVQADDLPVWMATQRAPEAELPAARLTAAEWNFAVGKSSGLFDKLQQMPVKLGQIAERISQGIRTSANEVYVLDVVAERSGLITAYSKQLEGEVVVERKAVFPFLQGKEIKAYSIQASGKVALIPYEVRAGKSALIPIGEFADRFPKAAAYLRVNKDYLEAREDGKMQGVGWHGFIYPKNLEVMSSPKLLVPDIADRTAFAYDEHAEFTFTSGYGITSKDSVKVSPKFLLGLLNSRLLDWFWKRVSTPLRGGFYRYFSQFIAQFPIRPLDFGVASERAEHDALVGLVEQVLATKQADPAADTAALERKIDDRVYRLYGLTSKEIKLVEEAAHK